MTINEIRYNGELISTEEVIEPVAIGMDYFLSLPAEEQQAILTLANGLVERAGELWDGTSAIPVDDPAKEPLRVVAEVALEAALPLL